jgi:hypothetical protein
MNRVQTLRSSVAKSRPTGRQPGELYVNFPDAQLGVVNAASTAQDLIGVRFFSTLTSYAIGDFVIQAGQLYRATQAVAAGAFNAAQWAQIGGTVVVSDTLPSNPQPGELWFDSVGGQLYCYYDDGNSKQWVVANTFSGGPYLALSGGTLTGPLNGTTAKFSGLTGVADGSNAVAGQIGEYITSSGGGGGMVSGSPASVGSLSLTAGDWDVDADVSAAMSGGAAISYLAAALNTTPASVANATLVAALPFTANTSAVMPLMTTRFSLAAAATVYLGAQVNFSAGGVTASGVMRARRVR